MNRKIYEELLNLKKSCIEKPLMVIGARQIGKTYIINEFCKNNFKNYVYINLLEHSEIINIFKENISTNEKYKSLYQAFIDTQNEYTFYCAPQMDSYLDSEMKFEKNIRMKLTSARKRYMNNEADIETLVWDTFQEFSDSME